MSETLTTIAAPSAEPDATTIKALSINDITSTFGKESVLSSETAAKDMEISVVSLVESIHVKVGDKIQLAAKAPDGELGRVRLVVDPSTKQRLIVAPPIQDGVTSEVATFIIAPVGTTTANGTELTYNQPFHLHVASHEAGKPPLSVNNNPTGMPDAIGLQTLGEKGEMTFVFTKPKDNSKIQFNDANLVLTCTDSNRTRKNFNNVVTLLKKSKATVGHGGYFTSCKKGPAISFTIARPNQLPAARLTYREISDAQTESDARSDAKSVVVSEGPKRLDSFTTAVQTPLPPTPAESFLAEDLNLPYVPPAVVLSPTTLHTDQPLKDVPLSNATAPPQPHKHDSVEENGSEVVHVNNTSPAIQSSDRFANLPLKSPKPTADLKAALWAAQQAAPAQDTAADDSDDVPAAGCTPCAQSVQSLGNMSAGRESHLMHSPRQDALKVAPFSKAVKMSALSSPRFGDAAEDLAEFQQSVERLKLQRVQLDRLQGVDAENEKLQSRVVHVEAKLELLDKAYREKRQALQEAIETRTSLEARWTEATAILHKMGDETTRTYESKLKLLQDELTRRSAKVTELEDQLDDAKAFASGAELKMEKKIKNLEAANADLEEKSIATVTAVKNTNRKLTDDLAAAQKRANNASLREELTLMDRLPSSHRRRRARRRCSMNATARMMDFLKRKTAMNKAKADLEARVKALEAQVKLEQAEAACHVQALVSSHQEAEAKVMMLEGRVVELEDALAAKDKRNDEVMQGLAKHERLCADLDAQTKELMKCDKKRQADVTELSMALRDAADEKQVLDDKIKDLQEQLEWERQDRATWASTRLKLLAQFCDEETKLSTTLGTHAKVSLHREDDE
ncbi:unnamed protein product [Aphanomyces euteiches]